MEYADVFGIPFDFTAKPVVAPPQTAARNDSGQGGAPRPRRARDPLPRVEGYRVELPEERLSAAFKRRLDPGTQLPTSSARPSPATPASSARRPT